MQKRFPRVLFLFLLLTTIFLFGCSYRPEFSLSEINTTAVFVETRQSIEISPPVINQQDFALLFYPGGLVDPHAYLPILSRFSEVSGTRIFLAKMPANLAVLDIGAGSRILGENPDIDHWILAGHSLGGAMAATAIDQDPEAYEGLILMDSYPPEGNSLKDWNGVVLSLFSSVEKVNDSERMQNTLDRIPPATWIENTARTYPAETTNYSVLHLINGGSHSFFGNYGPQDGDFPPLVTKEKFQTEVIDYMLEFFNKNNWR